MSAEISEKKMNVPVDNVMAVDSAVVCDSEAGEVSISKSVIAMIVRKCTLEIEGVSRFAPQRLVEGLADMLSKRNYERSIQIEFVEDEVIIGLTVIAVFGYPLAEIVKKIQETVKEKVEEIVDIKVDKINIFIKDLEEFDEGESVEEETPPVMQ